MKDLRGRVWSEDYVYFLDVDGPSPKYHRERGVPSYVPNPSVVSVCGLLLDRAWQSCKAVVLHQEKARHVGEPCHRCFKGEDA